MPGENTKDTLSPATKVVIAAKITEAEKEVRKAVFQPVHKTPKFKKKNSGYFVPSSVHTM